MNLSLILEGMQIPQVHNLRTWGSVDPISLEYNFPNKILNPKDKLTKFNSEVALNLAGKNFTLKCVLIPSTNQFQVSLDLDMSPKSSFTFNVGTFVNASSADPSDEELYLLMTLNSWLNRIYEIEEQ